MNLLRASANRLSACEGALRPCLMANAAPRCGARSKRTGKPCRGEAMPNGSFMVARARGRARRRAQSAAGEQTLEARLLLS
jgi:hypothetical protein